MAKVLVIDDDPSLLRALRLGLQAGGHDVVTAVNGEQGISQTALSGPDIVVLDLGLPDINGQTVCKRIRQWSEVPIIILSASGAEDRKVAALDGGADDYVTKPFGMAELEARIRTALRHRSAEATDQSPATMTVGSLDIDFVHHEAHLGGASVELTAKEFDVLSFLARHAGRTCTHQMILSAVWGTGY
jgi:two-component system KDP operon response regulator KdpE